LSAVLGEPAALDLDGRLGERALRAGPYLRWGFVGLAALWGVVSLTGLPPLVNSAAGEQRRGHARWWSSRCRSTYAAAVRRFLFCRRRHSVVLLSIPTADVLLAGRWWPWRWARTDN